MLVLFGAFWRFGDLEVDEEGMGMIERRYLIVMIEYGNDVESTRKQLRS